MIRRVVPLFAALLVGCQNSESVPGYDALGAYVSRNRSGVGADQWIEMRNNAGEWERTGLVFGYVDDYEECTKVAAGLKRVNFAREYRCVPAN